MKQITDNALRNSILRAFPDFKTAEFNFNHNGWTSVVVDVNNEYICKFPRTEQKRAFLETENIIIEKFANIFPEIEFPQRKFIDSDIPFFIHNKLYGEFIDADKYNCLAPFKQEKVIDGIASFFAKLHQLPIVEFQGIIKSKNEQLPNLSILYSALEPDFNTTEMEKISNIANTFLSFRDETSKVVGYYDFHAYNVLFDIDTGRVSGIFDFDEVAIGTAKFDLREVFLNYNMKIGTAVLNAYNKKVDNPVSIETVKLFLIGWSFVEYMNMKQKITSGELKDVNSADLSVFKKEIKQMIETY